MNTISGGGGLLFQMAGQRHPVQRIHDHIQKQKIEMPALLNFAQKVHAAAVGGDIAGNLRLLQDALGELNGLVQVGLLVVTDGDLIHRMLPPLYVVGPLYHIQKKMK